MRTILLVNALLLISLPSLCLADVLVLRDGTLAEGDVQGLLNGKLKSIPGPNEKAVTLADAEATHVGWTIEQLDADVKRFNADLHQREDSNARILDLKKHLKSFSSFRNDRITIVARRPKVVNTEELDADRLLNVECFAFNKDTRRFLLTKQSEGLSDNNYEYRLEDDVENKVRRASRRRQDKHHERLSDIDRIEPEHGAFFLLTFEAPLPKTEYLILDVCNQTFEYGDKLAHPTEYRFLIPYSSDLLPETRMEAATKAVDRYAKTGAQDDADNAMSLLIGLDDSDGDVEGLKVRHLRKWVERALAQLESEPVATNRKALNTLLEEVKWREILSTDPNVKRRLRHSRIRVLIARAEVSLITDLDSSLADYEQALSLGASSTDVASLKASVVTALSARCRASLITDLDSSLADYEQALSLGASSTDVASLKASVVTVLSARCRASLAEQNVAKAAVDYSAIARVDPQAAGGVTADFAMVPSSVLSELPASVLSQLPAIVVTHVIAQRPTQQNSIGMSFKSLPGGTFTMGATKDKTLAHLARPHQVTLTKPFELGVYEVTQEQYERVMGASPSSLEGPQNPVDQVSWHDAVEFCRKLSALPAEKSAGYEYRLPTEAEWEYACRAGTTTAYSFGDSDAQLGDYAWYSSNSGKNTHPVGGKKPNPWGLYDMYGNVFEWCQDWYGAYPGGAVSDPTGAPTDLSRLSRGGSWAHDSEYCRSARRSWDIPGYRRHSNGFRVLRSSVNEVGRRRPQSSESGPKTAP